MRRFFDMFEKKTIILFKSSGETLRDKIWYLPYNSMGLHILIVSINFTKIYDDPRHIFKDAKTCRNQANFYELEIWVLLNTALVLQ